VAVAARRRGLRPAAVAAVAAEVAEAPVSGVVLARVPVAGVAALVRAAALEWAQVAEWAEVLEAGAVQAVEVAAAGVVDARATLTNQQSAAAFAAAPLLCCVQLKP
jgi:hypothetical protein